MGNVLVTLTDKQRGIDAGSNGTLDYYLATVQTATHYYPFGWELVAMQYGAGYRYGYNGMEKSPEIGSGHHTTFFRENDSRSPRWWSIDPKTTAGESPYVMMGGNPVVYSDVMGDHVGVERIKGKNGRKDQVIISYTGVLLDVSSTDGSKGTLTKKELVKYRNVISNQLRKTYSGSGENITWKMNVDLKIINSPEDLLDEQHLSDNVIKLHHYLNVGSIGHAPNGIEAKVSLTENSESDIFTFTERKLRGVSGVAHTVVHEVGHNMGLPHIIHNDAGSRKKKIGTDKFPIWISETIDPLKSNIITKEHIIAKNIMLPGTQTNKGTQGYKVFESQILHIEQDFQNRLLNSSNISGGDFKWGNYPSDRPVTNSKAEVIKP